MKLIMVVTTVLVLCWSAFPTGASRAAEKWPERVVRIIVPYPAGGTADTKARIAAHQLQQRFNQTFVVENRSGAGGTLGAQMALQASPDGYLLVVSSVGPLIGGPIARPGVYDPINDFTHIAMLGGEATVLVVNPKQPIQNFKEFAAHAKAVPGGLSWGNAGPGSNGSLIGQATQQATGLPMVEISFKGGSDSLVAVLGNQIPAAFPSIATAASAIRSGSLRPIAITSSKRISDFPDVPTFAELGLPQLTGTAWYAISGPAGMQPALVEQINRAVRQAVFSPEAQAKFRPHYTESDDWDSPAVTQFVKDEIAKWSGYMKGAQSK